MNRPTELFKPFVLKCPSCMAPTEMGQTGCDYCKVSLVWEPVHSFSRDDARYIPKHIEHDERNNACVIGFGPVLVAPHATQICEMEPLRPFKGKRLFIESGIASYFLLRSLRVGMDYQGVSAGPIPCARLGVGEGLTLEMDVAMPGIRIVIEVENITSSPQVFAGLIEGSTIRYEQLPR